jgi:HEAT repeat-containing taxis protein
MIYYCPFCWFESSNPFETCPGCRQELTKLKEMDYAERLALSLEHPEPETRYRAAHLLGILKAVKVLPDLIRVAQKTEDIFLVQEIAWALGEINDPASFSRLSDFLTHPSFLVRKEAVQALGKLGGKSAREALSVACSDPIESVREAAKEIFKKDGNNRR